MAVLLFILAASIAQRPVLIERIAVVVGTHVIKATDIDRELRLTAVVNRQQVDSSPAARRKAAERLVDQQMIRDELSAKGYSRATNADADEMIRQITQQRFQGQRVLLQATLTRYGITQEQLHAQLLWQLTVLRFIDQRFRTGVLVTDEEIRSYYDQHQAEFQREYPKDYSLATLAPKIESSLEGERVNQQFESWLDETRKRTRVEFKEAAFQ